VVRPALALVVLAVSLAGPVGCELVDPCITRGDMLAGPGGLVLLAEEHPAGWGSAECLSCHALETTHVENCTSNPWIDMEGVREEASTGAYPACVGCHGENGVFE
jgi:hypothetical protein